LPGLSQCLSVPVDTSACTGTEPLVTNNETIGFGSSKWFYGAPATFTGLTLQAGGKLVVCGQLTVNGFSMTGGTLIIGRSGRLIVNTSGGASMVFTGNCSIYNLGYFRILCNLVLDGPDPWNGPVIPNIVWNAKGATFELANTYFVIEKRNNFFVNKGVASFAGIITSLNSDSAAVCLGHMSRMNVMLLENRKRNSYVAPEGAACVSVSHYGYSYENLTGWPSVLLCRGPSYCVGGCDSVARQNQKFGAASLFNACNSCSDIVLLNNGPNNLKPDLDKNPLVKSGVSPNPFRESFIITLPEPAYVSGIRIVDANGKLVDEQSRKMTRTNKITVRPPANLLSGAYFVQVITQIKTYYFTVMKQ